MSDIELTDLEAEFCRLPDVNAVRIQIDDSGRPLEVHVLATPNKPAKQVARDIQSVAMTSFGLELDRRIISIVQLGESQRNLILEEDGVSLFRPVLDHVSTQRTGMRSLVRVTLNVDDNSATGFSEGSVASVARYRLVVTATLDALRQLEPSAECIDVDSAVISRVGAHDVAVVTVVFVLGATELTIAGSAVVRDHQEDEAVVRAVLDATNRRLSQIISGARTNG